MSLGTQFLTLLLLAIPVACVAWTVTHEEVFREVHDWCLDKSRSCRTPAARKFFFLFTCEYCFSHYVTIGAVALTGYHLLLPDWRGYVLAVFAVVWIANVYMSLYGRLRLDIRHERTEIAVVEKALDRRLSPERRTRPSGPVGQRLSSGD